MVSRTPRSLLDSSDTRGARTVRRSVVSAVLPFFALGVLSACTPKFLAPDDLARVCRVAVEAKPEAFAFRSNPLFSPVGGPALGMAIGALAIVTYHPLLALVSIGGGAACGAASIKYPNAETDFQRIFHIADQGTLKRALEAELDARLAGCRKAQADPSAATVPDTVIQIESVEYLMACPLDDQTYSITVKWRALAAAGNRVLRETTTRCTQLSSRDAGSWAADGQSARTEIEHALTRTGQRIAAEFLATDELAECHFSPDEAPNTGPK